MCEVFERLFNGTRFGLGVDNKEIALGVWRIRYVLDSPSQLLRQQSRTSLYQDSEGNRMVSTGGVLTPIPASRSPVTELYQTSNVNNIPTYILDGNLLLISDHGEKLPVLDIKERENISI